MDPSGSGQAGGQPSFSAAAFPDFQARLSGSGGISPLAILSLLTFPQIRL
jgi:hypothetical protein